MEYTTVKELEQGTKFTYDGQSVMKLPRHTECYGNKCNAVNLHSGTMLWITPQTKVNLDTMTCE